MKPNIFQTFQFVELFDVVACLSLVIWPIIKTDTLSPIDRGFGHPYGIAHVAKTIASLMCVLEWSACWSEDGDGQDADYLGWMHKLSTCTE